MAETEKDPIPAHKSKGIYLLPNLFTTAGLFAGFYSIVAALKGHFAFAAIAIFIAMIADGLDGRVARLTNTESAFGAQYDSLSDMVSFGVAPALVAYSWGLSELGKLGWLAAFLYAAGTALRLARFNTQLGSTDKRFFIGLPCPAAAGVVAGMVWCGQEFNINAHSLSIIVALITAIAGCLMISNLRYHSFKQIDLKKHVPFFAIIVVVIVFILISVDPPTVLFLIFFLYALSGPIMSLRMRNTLKKRLWHRRKNKK